MGDFNQFLWVKKNVDNITGSVLEIGSKFYDKRTDINYRQLFPDMDYTGIDFQEGENVDIVIDITWDIQKIRKILNRHSYDCIICNSVLEHVDDLFNAVQNITYLLAENGILFVSVPFVWEEHGYPNDYWRFTKYGIKKLFSDLRFVDERSCYYSGEDYDFASITESVNSFMQNENEFHIYSDEQNSIKRKFKRVLRFLQNRKFRYEFIRRKNRMHKLFYKKCSINLFGVKK